jgi:hypothetical protein
MLSVYLLYWYKSTETDAATAGFWRALVALADVHDMGFRMVDPDDRVKMRHKQLPLDDTAAVWWTTCLHHA